ncbi:MAG TPA: DUF4388 domain-containing protein [Ktedonobacterales bacterium]|nr:DUF4388 domain-containing protein [Ktedonobacterales bacterium]
MDGRILDGDLATLGLQATLKILALGGKTGVLTVVSGSESLRVSLSNGHVVALEEPNIAPPDVVEIFRLLGRVPREQATELRPLGGDNPTAVLAVLVHWGLMKPAEMQQRVEFGVIQAVSRALRWERGRFQFDRDIVDIQGRIGAPQPFNVDHILLEALRMADEWDQHSGLHLTRSTVARWMPEFQGDVNQLGLSREDINVLCLSNGQLPLRAIAYGLLLPESRVAVIMQRLLDLGLIEVVDARLEAELEHSLVNLLTQTQFKLVNDPRATPDQRTLTLIQTMGSCVNGLLAHHAIFARTLRGRGELPRSEVITYVQQTFAPLVNRMHLEYPRMDEVIRLQDGQLDYADVVSLATVVRGPELTACYWDAVRLLYDLMQGVFDQVITDETGESRIGRQFHDLWIAFIREVEDEIGRQQARLAALNLPSDREPRGRGNAGSRQGNDRADAVFAPARESRRRFS